MTRPQRCLPLSLTAMIVVAAIAGCSSIGPGSVTRDRFDYNTAITDSWKEQTLLNIVKIRYADMPLFIEVASIVAGYTMESQVRAGGSFPSNSNFGGDTLSVSGSGRFIDRPTITYVPITGQQFNRSFMTPIPPQAVLFLMQSGWPADLVFPMVVDSMNGLRTQIAAGASQRAGDNGFYRAIALLRKIQLSGALGMRIQQSDSEETTVLMFHRERISDDIQAALEELRDLLHVEAGSGQLRVIYSQVQEDGRDFAMLTRSMLQIMIDMATQVDVPESHVADGRTPPSIASEDVNDPTRLIRIHFSEQPPENAFVVVPYRDHYFYIDDRDFKSKRAFTFLMVLSSLSEKGGNDALPLVTIPAG